MFSIRQTCCGSHARDKLEGGMGNSDKITLESHKVDGNGHRLGYGTKLLRLRTKGVGMG